MGCCAQTIDGSSFDNEELQFIKQKLIDEYNMYLNFIQSIKNKINQNETISKYFYIVPLSWFENWEKTVQMALDENKIKKPKFDFKYKNIGISQKCNFEIISEELWNKILKDNLFSISKEKRKIKKGNLCNGKIIFSNNKFIEIFFYENEDDLFFKNLIVDCSNNDEEIYKIYYILKTSPIQEILGNINYNELNSYFKFKGYNSLIINKPHNISSKIKKFREYKYQIFIRINQESNGNDKKENENKSNNNYIPRNTISNFIMDENRNFNITDFNLNLKQNNDNENSDNKKTSCTNNTNNEINNDNNDKHINIHNISNKNMDSTISPISDHIISLNIQNNNNNKNLKIKNLYKIPPNNTNIDTKISAFCSDKLQISRNLNNYKNNLEKKIDSSFEEINNNEKLIFIQIHNKLNINSSISNIPTCIENNNISNINDLNNTIILDRNKNTNDKNYIFAFINCLCSISELNNYINNLNELNYSKKILSNVLIQIIKNKNNNENYAINNINFFSIKDFLETLHSELNSYKQLNESNKIEIYSKENQLSIDNNNIECLNKIIKKFKEKNNSIISELFYGLKELKYVCSKCFNSKILYETNIYISLDMAEINYYFNNKINITINDCISFYMNNNGEITNCLSCQNPKINKTNNFIIFPQILIIYFNHENTEIKNKKIKIEELIEFEKKNYELISFILINNNKLENKFEYNSYCKDGDNWYEYKENNKIILQKKINEIINESNISTVFYKIIK